LKKSDIFSVHAADRITALGVQPRKALDFSRHVRLIGISGNCGQIRESWRAKRSACAMEEALKAQHRLKHFRTITNSGGESPLQLSMADSDRAAQLFNGGMWVARKPSYTRHNRAVR